MDVSKKIRDHSIIIMLKGLEKKAKEVMVLLRKEYSLK
jgi:hypothetical protein